MRNASPFFGAYLIYKEARPLTHKRVKSYLKIAAFFKMQPELFYFLMSILLYPRLPESKCKVFVLISMRLHYHKAFIVNLYMPTCDTYTIFIIYAQTYTANVYRDLQGLCRVFLQYLQGKPCNIYRLQGDCRENL